MLMYFNFITNVNANNLEFELKSNIQSTHFHINMITYLNRKSKNGIQNIQQRIYFLNPFSKNNNGRETV